MMALFLHLSDMHIGQARAKAKRSTYEICHEDFLNDCAEWLEKNSEHQVDAILITGDVSYSASKDDFADAAQVIKSIRDRVNAKRVLIVPGNHDIDRRAINLLELRRQQSFRNSELTKADESFHKFFVESGTSYDPMLKLRNFNQFLRENDFGKEATLEPWFVDLVLKDQWSVRLHGFCSVFVSNDEDEIGNMFLGSRQFLTTTLAKADRDHIVLIHHPLNWLRDYEPARSALMPRVKVMLSGHAHSADLFTMNDVVSIHAGALNPSPQELVPFTYNWIRLSADQGNKPLKVDWYPRKWTPQKQSKFSPDDRNQRYNAESQCVTDWLTSNFDETKIGRSRRYAEEAQEIADDKLAASCSRLLLLKPPLFQAIRSRISIDDVSQKASAEQLLREIRRNEILDDKTIDDLRVCIRAIYRVGRYEAISEAEVEWALQKIPELTEKLENLNRT